MIKSFVTTHGNGVLLYLAALNLAGFLCMGADKRRSRRGAWRVPERTLFLVALLGGSVGSLAGMRAFRHKTRHRRFTIGIPLILAAQLALLVCFLR